MRAPGAAISTLKCPSTYLWFSVPKQPKSPMIGSTWAPGGHDHRERRYAEASGLRDECMDEVLSFPDPREDLESRSPNLGPYTTY